MDSTFFDLFATEISKKFLRGRKDAPNVDGWRILLPEDHLMEAVEKCADHLNKTFADQKILLIPVHPEEICFPSDLLKKLIIPTSLGRIRSGPLDPAEFENRKVVLVETLFDHGSTLNTARNYLISSGVKSEDIYTCSLYKKEGRKSSSDRTFGARSARFSLNFSSLVVPDLHLVGYGTSENQGWTALYARPEKPGDQVFESTEAYAKEYMKLIFQLQLS